MDGERKERCEEGRREKEERGQVRFKYGGRKNTRPDITDNFHILRC